MSAALDDDILQQTLQAYRDNGFNKTKTALQLGIPRTTLRDRLEISARRGFAPEAQLDHPVAEGFELRGYSHFTKTALGEPIWLKTRAAERDYWDFISGAISGVVPVDISTIEPLAEAPQGDIIPWLQIGDAHIGMLASEAETGSNFDIDIAEREICAAVAYLIDQAPYCERFVVNDLGDGTHYETYKALTEASGHAVDYDTRYPKMIRAYCRIMRFVIDKALTKAENVDFIANQGNHSQSNDIWIAELVRHVYAETGRVNVLANDSPFIGYRMGKTMVMVHHGHKCKPQRLREVMANDFSADWGETDFRYIDGGHVHSTNRIELAGCVWESWNNLAPNDKYAHDGGWRSKACMSLALRSKTYGETGRIRIPIERVRDIILGSGIEHYVPKVQRAFAA